jgi:hypothetical protein
MSYSWLASCPFNFGARLKNLFYKRKVKVGTTNTTMKQHLLKSLDYLYQTPPSKFNTALITRFKWNLLPELMTFISASPEQPQLDTKSEKTAEEIAKDVGLIS